MIVSYLYGYLQDLLPLAASILLGCGINAVMRRIKQPEIKHLQLKYHSFSGPMSNVEAMNMKSSGCSGFTQLE